MSGSNLEFWTQASMPGSMVLEDLRKYLARDYESVAGDSSVRLNRPAVLERIFEGAITLTLAGDPDAGKEWMRGVLRIGRPLLSLDGGDRSADLAGLCQACYFSDWCLNGHQDASLLDTAWRLLIDRPWVAPDKRSQNLKSLLAWTLVQVGGAERLRSLLDRIGLLREPSKRVSPKPSEGTVLNLVLGVMEGHREFEAVARENIELFMQQNIKWYYPGSPVYSPVGHGLKWAHARSLLFTGSTNLQDILADIKMPDVTLRP